MQLAEELSGLLGPGRVRAPHDGEVACATLIVEPRSEAEVVELVRKCERDQLTVAPLGSGRTLAALRGAPVQVGVSLVRMARTIAYEPADMTLVCEAGATLSTIAELCGANRQRLSVDPPAPPQTTLGALIAGAKSGPLRLSEGTVRDLLIGIRFVGHGGRIVRAGGRVVKNVAGYDLMKVMTGSFGTLGIIVEAVLKVRPIPPRYELIVACYDSCRDAFAAAERADATGPLAHCEVLSPELTGGAFELHAGYNGGATEVGHHRAALKAVLGQDAKVLEAAAAHDAYQRLRDLALDNAAIAAQAAVPRAELARFLDESGAEFRAHALCGVAQLYRRECENATAARDIVARWRERAEALRGNLRLIALAPELRDQIDIFDTPPPSAFALMRRLKQTFDPRNIFNPGCFVGGL